MFFLINNSTHGIKASTCLKDLCRRELYEHGLEVRNHHDPIELIREVFGYSTYSMITLSKLFDKLLEHDCKQAKELIKKSQKAVDEFYETINN